MGFERELGSYYGKNEKGVWREREMYVGGRETTRRWWWKRESEKLKRGNGKACFCICMCEK